MPRVMPSCHPRSPDEPPPQGRSRAAERRLRSAQRGDRCTRALAPVELHHEKAPKPKHEERRELTERMNSTM